MTKAIPTSGAVVVLGAILAALTGWVMNLIAFIGMLGDNTITAMLIGRAFGIVVAPLGAVLGYF